MNRPRLPQPRPAAKLALVAALALAGCGSSHSASGAGGPRATRGAATGCPPGPRLCVTQSTSLKAKGSPLIDANLERAIARNQPQLSRPVVTCPQAQRYPVRCRVSGRAPIGGRRQAVTGTVTVIGIEVHTRTYAYQLLYAPGR